MNNGEQVTWTVCDTPPERAYKKKTRYQKWSEVFTQIAESTNGEWVELDGEFSQGEAQSVYQAARRHSEGGTLGKVNCAMRTARVLDETFRDGTKKRMYSLFINVEKSLDNSGDLV